MKAIDMRFNALPKFGVADFAQDLSIPTFASNHAILQGPRVIL